MPVANYAKPETVHCDFCGRPFALGPKPFNCRTCVACAAAGAPDQSAMTWGRYRRRAADWSRAQGRRVKLSGAALAAKSGQFPPQTTAAARFKPGTGSRRRRTR